MTAKRWMAMIEQSVPPDLRLVANGDEYFCRKALARYLKRHGLRQYERAVLAVRGEVLDHEGVSLEIVDQLGRPFPELRELEE